MGRYTRERRKNSLSQPEITLTPLIDTALTLLIIFMVTTPMIKNAIKIDLPKGQAKEGANIKQELVVAIDKDEHIYFNNKAVNIENLAQLVKQQLNVSDPSGKKHDRSVWVKIDRSKSCSANILISVMDRLRVLGIKDVIVATEKSSTRAA